MPRQPQNRSGWTADLETEIEALRARLTTLEAVWSMLASLDAEPVAKRPTRRPRATASTPRRQTRSVRQARAVPVAPGSVAARVLEILAEAKRPMKAKEICAAKTGADAGTVMKAIRVLAAEGRIMKLGATVSLRYALPAYAEESAA